MAAPAEDDLAEHTKRMPRYFTRGLTTERLRSALEILWQRVRAEFVRKSERDPGNISINLDSCEFKYPISLQKDNETFSSRGNRLGMRHIRMRALQDEELKTKYGLPDVHLDWTEDCGGEVYFRCKATSIDSKRETEIVDHLCWSHRRGSSMRQFYDRDASVLLDPVVRQRIEARFGFRIECFIDLPIQSRGVMVTWDRPAVYPPPNHPSWDEL